MNTSNQRLAVLLLLVPCGLITTVFLIKARGPRGSAAPITLNQPKASQSSTSRVEGPRENGNYQSGKHNSDGANAEHASSVRALSTLPLDLRKRREDVLMRSRYIIENIELSVDRLEGLKDLLFERELAQNDARDVVRKYGGTNQQQLDAVNAAAKEIDNQIRTFLGEEGYDRFVNLAKESGYKRMLQREYEGAMLDARIPLSDEQLNRLAVILTDVGYRDPFSKTPEARVIDPVIGLRKTEEAFFARAGSVLSADQVDRLQILFVQKNLQELRLHNQIRDKK
jgi:hypothetical protein